MHTCCRLHLQDQPWLPQIVVCPSSLNAMAMLDNLIRATYQDVLTPERMDQFKLSLAKVKIMDEYHRSYTRPTSVSRLSTIDLTPYESCFHATGELSESCSFVLVLAALLERLDFYEAQKIIVTYAATTVVDTKSGGIIDYMSMKYNISLVDIYGVNSTSLTSYNGVLMLYQTFFHVLNTTTDELVLPQALSSYTAKYLQFELPKEKNLGLFFSWILNGYSKFQMDKGDPDPDGEYNAGPEFSDLVASTWLDALMASYLRVGSHEGAK